MLLTLNRMNIIDNAHYLTIYTHGSTKNNVRHFWRTSRKVAGYQMMPNYDNFDMVIVVCNRFRHSQEEHLEVWFEKCIRVDNVVWKQPTLYVTIGVCYYTCVPIMFWIQYCPNHRSAQYYIRFAIKLLSGYWFINLIHKGHNSTF